MASRFVQRLALTAILLGGVGMTVASTAEATRPVRRTTRPGVARGFNLFAGAVNVLLNVNRVQCNINPIGEACVDPTNSPVVGGGFWPKGTPDQYIFNTGLQIAGFVAGTKTTTFPWPGDTIGAFFFDPRGDQAHGEGRTLVFNSLKAEDVAAWPTAAYANDTSLFDAQLIGRATVSQQDTWVRYWDGNTNLTTGRQHPMGLLVEQRSLAWNFPSGNQDIIYLLFRFINITARDATKYAGLANAGYAASDISDIVAIANDFQDRAEATFNVQIPDTGYSFTNLFASFAEDPDEGQAGSNYSTGNLPFAMGFVMKSNFREAAWQFPPDIFAAPFAVAPGFQGAKYLKSPQNLGIAIFSNTTNGPPFPDAVGVQRLWRNLSGNLLPTDGTCSVGSVPAPQNRHICFVAQVPTDTRFFASSGPFTLNPGESAVIVVGLVHAAPVASQPACNLGAGSRSAFSLTPFIGGDMKPGLPVDGTRLVQNLDSLNNVDRAIGWVCATDANADGKITQSEVTTTPRSLLNKSLVAQAVFDNKFLLPFAPEPPTFFLIPGDNRVTVAWQISSTETVKVGGGDPFFAVASNVASPLYDANFRQYDVEGYRIWRGRSEASLEVIASFDYAGTTIIDYNGQFFNSTDYGSFCAPELGVITSCPTFPHDIPLAGDVVQIPPGGRVLLSSGAVFNVSPDTAVTGGNSGLPALVDNGVPFAYVDKGVRDGFRYFYAVTAFDVNSVKSGPSSLESPLVTKQVTPRANSSNNVPAVVVTGVFGSDGTELDPSAKFPSIDANNGTFNGIIPPTNAGRFGFLASVAEALSAGDYIARIDSVSAGFADGIGAAPTMYLSLIGGTDTVRVAKPIPVPSFFDGVGDPGSGFSVSGPLARYDSSRSRLLGISFTRDVRMPVEFADTATPIIYSSPSIALTQGRFGHGNQASRYLSHSRWFDEGGSEPPDPTINPFGSAAHTNGKLTGVTTIYSPLVYRLPFTGGTAAQAMNRLIRGYGYSMIAWYPADFVVTWNADSSVTVRDSTHHVTLPFTKGLGTGYGFVNARTFGPAGIASGDLDDGTGTANINVVGYHHLYGINPVCTPDWWDINCAPMQRSAAYQPIDITNDGASDGSGIAIVINGEAFFMLMPGIPAAGTKWHLRAVGGAGMNATCTPALPTSRTTDLLLAATPTDCSGYNYTSPISTRPAYAPGLQYKIRVTQAFSIASSSGDLTRIHTVPDPYYVTNQLEITANTKVLRFVNLPDRAIIRIYSASGILVTIVSHNDAGGGGEAVWNLRNRNNQFVASGVYFYHVETPDGRSKVGRFTVVNFAQ